MLRSLSLRLTRTTSIGKVSSQRLFSSSRVSETMSVLEKSLEDMKEVNGDEFRVVRSDDKEMIVHCDNQGTILTSHSHSHTSHTNTKQETISILTMMILDSSWRVRWAERTRTSGMNRTTLGETWTTGISCTNSLHVKSWVLQRGFRIFKKNTLFLSIRTITKVTQK